MPEISVIVPVYNVEKYLEKCIDSILNQTFKDFELILINDGSTDNSGEICNHYANIDNRIHVINKENGGLSDARNHGIKIASGKYLCFIDSDDYIHPQMLEILYQDILKHQADITCCNFLRVYENQNIESYKISILQEEQIYTGIELIEHLSNRVEFVIAWNKLYKKELFNQIAYKVGVKHEDEYIIHHLLLQTKKFVYRNCELYYYVQRCGSIMDSQKSIVNLDGIFMYRERWKSCSYFVDKKVQDKLCYTYINYFLKQFKKYMIKGCYDRTMSKCIYLFKKDLLSSFANNEYSLKEKMTWILFIITPKLYNRYFQ